MLPSALRYTGSLCRPLVQKPSSPVSVLKLSIHGRHVVGTSGGPDSCLIEVLWNSWRDDTLTSDIRPGVAKAGGSKQHVVGMTFLDKKVVERLFGDSRMFSARDIPRHASGIPRTIVEMCRA
jgi:hypothetical protein